MQVGTIWDWSWVWWAVSQTTRSQRYQFNYWLQVCCSIDPPSETEVSFPCWQFPLFSLAVIPSFTWLYITAALPDSKKFNFQNGGVRGSSSRVRERERGASGLTGLPAADRTDVWLAAPADSRVLTGLLYIQPASSAAYNVSVSYNSIRRKYRSSSPLTLTSFKALLDLIINRMT